MTKMLVPIVAVVLFASTGVARAEAETEPYTESRGFIGSLLGVGFGVNGQLDTGLKPFVQTSLLFGLRGGLLMGKEHRGVLTFEVAPVTNKLDWNLRPTATGLVSGGGP